MNEFQKSQSEKILSMYSNLDDILKAKYADNYQNRKLGRVGQEYGGKGSDSKSSKIKGLNPKDFASIIKKDQAKGRFPLGFIQVDDKTSPLHGKYFKIASVRAGQASIYIDGKRSKEPILTKNIGKRILASDVKDVSKEVEVEETGSRVQLGDRSKSAEKKISKTSERSEPQKIEQIKQFTESNVGAELKRFLPHRMKLADIDVYDDGKTFSAYIETGERGPRTDHGGGSSGNDWMSHTQVGDLRETYVRRFQPTINKIEKEFKKRFKGSLGVQVDYGEKGHVGLQVVGKLK